MIKTQFCQVNTVKEFLARRKDGYGIPYIQCSDELNAELYEYFKKLKKRDEEETLCYAVLKYRRYRDKYSSPFMMNGEEQQADANEIWTANNELHSLYFYKGNIEACAYVAWIALDYYPTKNDGKIELTKNIEIAKKYANLCIEKGYAYGYCIMAEIEGGRTGELFNLAFTDEIKEDGHIDYLMQGYKRGCEYCKERLKDAMYAKVYNVESRFNAWESSSKTEDSITAQEDVKVLKEAIAFGLPEAEGVLGQFYFAGYGVSCDYEKAYLMSQKSMHVPTFLDDADMVSPNSCIIQAYLGLHNVNPNKYPNPLEVIQKYTNNPIAVLKYLEWANLMDEYGKYARKLMLILPHSTQERKEDINVALGKSYYYGYGVNKDEKLGKEFLLQAGDKGKAQLALIYIESGNDKLYPLAYDLIKQCYATQPLARYVLANMYYNGILVERNIEKAREVLKENSQTIYECSLAASLLGHIEQDAKEKARLYTIRIDDGGNIRYLFSLLMIIYMQDENMKNPRKAFNVAYKATYLKDGTAALNLAIFYETGYGCKKDEQKAFEFYRLALAWGDDRAKDGYERLKNKGFK